MNNIQIKLKIKTLLPIFTLVLSLIHTHSLSQEKPASVDQFILKRDSAKISNSVKNKIDQFNFSTLPREEEVATQVRDKADQDAIEKATAVIEAEEILLKTREDIIKLKDEIAKLKDEANIKANELKDQAEIKAVKAKVEVAAALKAQAEAEANAIITIAKAEAETLQANAAAEEAKAEALAVKAQATKIQAEAVKTLLDSEAANKQSLEAVVLKNEEEVNERDKLITNLQTKAIKVGFSIGPKWNNEGNYSTTAYLSSENYLLQLDTLSNSSLIFSTSLLITPGQKSTRLSDRLDQLRAWGGEHPSVSNLISRLWIQLLRNASIVANLNLIEFSNDKEALSFNKAIDGGVGFGIKISEKIYVSYTWEWFTSRELRSFYKKRIGQQLLVSEGVDNLGSPIIVPLNALDQSNDTYFNDEVLKGKSIKISIVF